jgi:hypothetical protein
MAFANLTDIAVTTLNARSKKLADNVLKNNALLKRIAKKGNAEPLSGGNNIYEPFLFQENGNFTWMSGYDLIPVAAQDVISGASFGWKQAAVSVVISGLEELQNSGKEKVFDLLKGRMMAAEKTMLNNLCSGAYSDGTGNGGKQINGLASLVTTTPSTGTTGGIDRSQWAFWRNQLVTDAAYTSSTIYKDFLSLYLACSRGSDVPDLIIADNNVYTAYDQSLQALQRFTNTEDADGGYANLKFRGADVVFDGGIGGFCPADRAYFLNTEYLLWRPHKDRNMVPLKPGGASPVNQDATVAILAWAGNMTCRGLQFQGLFKGS